MRLVRGISEIVSEASEDHLPCLLLVLGSSVLVAACCESPEEGSAGGVDWGGMSVTRGLAANTIPSSPMPLSRGTCCPS